MLANIVVTRGAHPLTGSEEISATALSAAIGSSGASIRAGDAVLVRTGKVRELDHPKDDTLEAQPRIGLDGAIYLADAGMVVFRSDTGGTEPQPVRDWERSVHVEPLTRRGIHLLEWLDLDRLATELAARPRTDFLFIATPLRITGATGSWVRQIAVL